MTGWRVHPSRRKNCYGLILQVLYSIRRERLFMDQMDYNLQFRWVVGLSIDDTVWDHAVFPKNREHFTGEDFLTKSIRLKKN